MSNIYLDLELSLDPPITEAAALTNELNTKIAHWQKLTQYSADYQQKINLAQQYLRQGLFNLPAQAEEARTQQLLNLQQTAAKLFGSTSDTGFAKDYLQRNFSAFQESTIDTALLEARTRKPSKSNLPQPAIPAAEKQKPFAPKVTFTEWKKIFTAHWKKAAAVCGILFALYLLVNILSFMGSMLPSVSIGGSSPDTVHYPSGSGPDTVRYPSGSSPDTVRYPNRDYSKAKWQRLSESAQRGITLFVKDKNHFVRGYGNDIYHYDAGQWKKIGMPANTSINIFYRGIFTTRQNEIGIFDPKSWSFVKLPDNFPQANMVLEMEKGVYYVGAQYNPNIGVIFSGGKVQELRDDDKRLYIWDGKTNCGSIFGLFPMQTYKNGAAIGWNTQDSTLAKYSTRGGWTKHLDTTHRGRVFSLWAIDDKNFVLVGDGITVFKNGNETHPVVNVSEFPPNKPFDIRGCVAVWGTDIDHFWVMDENGNIIQWKNGTFTKAVAAPPTRMRIKNSWISPDGAAFAGFSSELWRLD